MRLVHPYSCRGFTLVELAMVLMIVGLLLGGLIVPLSAQMEQRRAAETQRTLEEIKEALTGYAVINGQLPCPADPAIPTGSANAGIANCAFTSGVVPWATLGTSETDGWGNRFTYRADTNYTDAVGTTFNCTPPVTPSQSSFALCTTGSFTVLSAAAGGTNVAIQVPAIVLSHGKNSAGAYTQSGSQIPASGNADEAENSDGDADNNYVSHTATPAFDDLVVWISNSILLNRMVTAGKLP